MKTIVENDLTALGDELYQALQQGWVVEPLTARQPALTIEQAYRIQQRLIARRVAAGERVIGKKIGVTSQAVMDLLGVRQPDFGVLTDAMRYASGATLAMRSLIQPKAEGEIAFVLKHELRGPGVREADVLDATRGVAACFEVVDSRIRDWKIRIQDTVADNASCGAFVLSDRLVDPAKLELPRVAMTLQKNGQTVVTGSGSATMGSPLAAVTWLANMLGSLGQSLNPGDIILSGALGAMVPVAAGDKLRMSIEGIGECAVDFA